MDDKPLERIIQESVPGKEGYYRSGHSSKSRNCIHRFFGQNHRISGDMQIVETGIQAVIDLVSAKRGFNTAAVTMR